MEAIWMSYAGYPTRKPFDEFVDQFGILAPEVLDARSDEVTAYKTLLEKVALEGYQIGKSKIFLRAGQMAELDAHRTEVLGTSASIVQRKVRSYLCRRSFILIRRSAIQMQAVCRGIMSALLGIFTIAVKKRCLFRDLGRLANVMEDGKLAFKHMLSSHRKPVSLVAWSPDDTKLLTCGNAEVLKLWDVETGTCLRTFGDPGFIVSSCAWFPDSKRLVCGSSNPEKGIFMWDCDGKELSAWKGKRMPKVSDLAVTPDGEHLIVVSDKEIRKFNVKTFAEQLIVEAHSITSLSVSVNGEDVIVNLNSEEIHLWDAGFKWHKPLRFTGHKQNKA
ncbi:WD repeat-containing protein WDS homolog [Linum grandiflorum]